MSTTVYAMGVPASPASPQAFGETIDVVVSNTATGTTGATVTGYGQDFLTDFNQATITRCVHGSVLGAATLTPTVHKETIVGNVDTSLLQSVALVNVKAQYQTETIATAPALTFNISGGGTVVYPLGYCRRTDGAIDFYWSGDVPAGATDSYVQFGLGGVSGSTYIDIGQVIASSYNQSYTWPCTGSNTINAGDSVMAERNIDQIQTIGGQRFDKFLFQRYVWSGELTTTDQTFMANLQWWQRRDGIYIISDEWGYRAPTTAGLYGKLRLGSMADETSDPTVYRVPFEFQENPA